MGLPTSPQRSPNLPVKKIPVHIKVSSLKNIFFTKKRKMKDERYKENFFKFHILK